MIIKDEMFAPYQIRIDGRNGYTLEKTPESSEQKGKVITSSRDLTKVLAEMVLYILAEPGEDVSLQDMMKRHKLLSEYISNCFKEAGATVKD